MKAKEARALAVKSKDYKGVFIRFLREKITDACIKGKTSILIYDGDIDKVFPKEVESIVKHSAKEYAYNLLEDEEYRIKSKFHPSEAASYGISISW
ncbi:MAG: hypothetical protein GY845_25795 [Planctomycetes bacterium]|nr:hypothetical protein [Planctomycetota bacterium]